MIHGRLSIVVSTILCKIMMQRLFKCYSIEYFSIAYIFGIALIQQTGSSSSICSKSPTTNHKNSKIMQNNKPEKDSSWSCLDEMVDVPKKICTIHCLEMTNEMTMNYQELHCNIKSFHHKSTWWTYWWCQWWGKK